MQKIFEARLNIKFSKFSKAPYQIQDNHFEFASSHGLSGTLKLRELEWLSESEARCTVQISADQKKGLPDLDSYIALIEAVLNQDPRVYVRELSDINIIIAETSGKN